MGFQFVHKSMTLNDLELSKHMYTLTGNQKLICSNATFSSG